ncbi:MAG: 2-oxoglutarate dehydrogenase E1 component [Zetaproteobacteria bacterium]|nr:MAG: 2-oxoglutarate dehydrogenase E1 component [Zetaproteobacteria bacterium]
MLERDDLFGAGSDYLEDLYEQWRADPSSVSPEWAAEFAALAGEHPARPRQTHREMLARMAIHPGGVSAEIAPTSFDIEYPSRALYLIQGYRFHGHLHADLDPLHLQPPRPSPELELGYYGLGPDDLDIEFPVGDLAGGGRRRLGEILDILRKTYCGHIGPEFMHITDSVRRHWLQQRLEGVCCTPNYAAPQQLRIYRNILHAEEFEKFLHTRYTGQKRFSLEGGESLIAMLDTLIQKAGKEGVKELILGMAHRGRLNVLANILGKSLSDIFAEFEGEQLEEEARGQGDVKYHLGFSSDIETPGGALHVSLAFNPSHLEIITPVVLGGVRARQCRRRDKNKTQVLPVLIHGDAAFAGQGVVAESLNLSKLGGFRVGGTVHIVVNNQIGFTVNPFDARSSLYATDIAKMVQAPILHVNGDDPEACCLATEIAFEYRNQFHEDIVLDLICYRRRGHNEADAPEVTQPLMYRKIATHPTVASLYRDQLIAQGVLTQEESDSIIRQYRECMDEVRRNRRKAPSPVNTLQGRWAAFSATRPVEPETGVHAEILAELCARVHTLPPGFTLHPRVQKIFEQRWAMMRGEQPVDWGCAETMAYATLVNEGGWVRLSGQDSGRGTFFHRHAVVYDQRTGRKFMPLRQVENGEMSHFLVVDSLLSELAVMAYEYGYSVAEPRALVIWEAQYGDFANNAQVVIDQFIASGESKWSRMSGLVLWLPHGYEGQGAEHSSARMERYLQLCAEDNMQVVYPTTPAQLFHLLRRQLRINIRKPLILLGPKSMLRQKRSFSPLSAFVEGRFEPVLDEADPAIAPHATRRLILCSGKVYYDLLAERERQQRHDVAIVRIERLYPFPEEALKRVTARFAATQEVVWLQEEPLNQGAWFYIAPHIQRCLHENQYLARLGRKPAAAPAAGSLKRHKRQQQWLVERAFADRPVPRE